MQIVEVKNNLVKLSYNAAEDLVLSGFVVIRGAQSFIAQIIHLEANQEGNFAVAKLLFNFDENGIIANYNGAIPDVKSIVGAVQSQELLELLPVQNPVTVGELAQQQTMLQLDKKVFERNLLVCSEKQEDNEILIQNFARQLSTLGKKVLIIDAQGSDFGHELAQNKITAGRDFKLPLNYDTINFIYEKGLEEAKAETKALIQDVFLEVQNYVKTLSDKFIPFETFKNVVDEQYEQMQLVELVLLKNKLLKYYESGIFAQEKNEFNSLKLSLKSKAPTVFDVSQIDEKIQREMISYAYSLAGEIDKEIYIILNVTNANSDKKLLKQIFTSKAFSTIISSYSFKYLKELKQLSKDLILFAPIQQQDDFAGYGVFLSKLNMGEFVIYGHATHHLPLIVKLEKLSEAQVESVQSVDTTVEEQIKRDVDEIYMAREESAEDDVVLETVNQQDFEQVDLTEDDLDFLDDLNIAEGAPETDSEDEIFEELQTESNEVEPDLDSELFSQIEEIQEEMQEEDAEEGDESESFSNVLQQQGMQEEQEAPAIDILPVQMASTPIVPIYSADIEPKVQSDSLEQGDAVSHPKYGKGVVEKLISYGPKTLCSINFDNVGRRLLDPSLAEIKKI